MAVSCLMRTPRLSAQMMPTTTAISNPRCINSNASGSSSQSTMAPHGFMSMVTATITDHDTPLWCFDDLHSSTIGFGQIVSSQHFITIPKSDQPAIQQKYAIE